MKPEGNEIQHIIGVCGSGNSLFMLLTVYDEADALGAVGQVLHTQADTAHGYSVLATNQPLSCMWCSPLGRLWVASSSGYLWTTAQSAPAQYTGDAVDSQTPEAMLSWQFSKLPSLADRGYSPNATAITGIDDRNLFVGTFTGTVYRWDGSAWSQFLLPGSPCINELSGTTAEDVWAAGYDSLIAHFDGKVWTRVALPPEVPRTDVVTGIRSTGPQQAIACTRSGKLLSGNPAGFRVLHAVQAEFYGVGVIDQNTYLAGGRSGIWQATPTGMVSVKPNLQAVDVFETPDLGIYFIEPEQPEPCVIMHKPGDKPIWIRETY